jgi:hypothetical protein
LDRRLIAFAVLAGTAASAAPRAHLAAKPLFRPAPAPAVPPGGDPPISYTARKGDNLYNLGRFYLVHLGDYRVVQKLNKVSNPYRLRIGTKLAIPRSLLRSDLLQARVVSFRGSATIDGKAAILGATVGEGGLIRTGPNASISVVLADGSTVTLPSQSLVRVERLRRFHLTNELDRLFKLEDGRSETHVTPRTNGRDRFEMRTPISVAAVRGTDFRVSLLDSGRTSTAEVLDGHVDFAGIGAEVMLDPGTGARFAADGAIGPIPLLPPPDILDPAQIQSEPDLAFHIAPLPGAAHYRMQIAKDAGFLDILGETVVDQPQASLSALPNGDYFVRVTAMDVNEIEGQPHVVAFERHLNAVRATIEPQSGHRYLFKWQNLGEGEHMFRFFMARADAPESPVIDEPVLVRKSLVITNLLPGDYVWRVQASEVSNGKRYANWSSPQTFTVAAKPGPATSRAKPPAS